VPELRTVGVTDGSSLSMQGFTVDAGPGNPARFVVLAIRRFDTINERAIERNLLLILQGTQGEGPVVPWWDAPRLLPVAAFDLPRGVRAVGGAHDLVAIQDDGRNAPGQTRWMFIRLEELLSNGFLTHTVFWDDQLVSTAITSFPEDRWRDGAIESVVRGNDGPWVQALGPLTSRLGLYRAWSGVPPLLQRQMVRGAASDGEGLLGFLDQDDEDENDGQVVRALEPVRHDYLLESPDLGRDPRLLTVGIRTNDNGDPPVLEFHASPRS